MESTINNISPTFESVWALMQENAKRQEETDRMFKERDRILTEKFAETDRILTEKFAETSEQMKETDRKLEKALQGLINLKDRYGSMSNNIGSFAEEYFYNSIDKGGVNFFGKKFDEIEKNVKQTWKKLRDEYDIVLYNDDAVAIIEVKFKANTNDINKILKKAETFKILFPYYKDYKIFLGLASMSFNSELEKKCKEEGIAIIKQEGDTVIIIDKHLKIF